jgi:hypothetical protein
MTVVRATEKIAFCPMLRAAKLVAVLTAAASYFLRDFSYWFASNPSLLKYCAEWKMHTRSAGYISLDQRL